MMTVHERFLHHPVVASTNRVYQHRPQTNPTVGNYAACKIYWDSVFHILRKSAQIGLTVLQDFDNFIFNTCLISSLRNDSLKILKKNPIEKKSIAIIGPFTVIYVVTSNPPIIGLSSIVQLQTQPTTNSEFKIFTF